MIDKERIIHKLEAVKGQQDSIEVVVDAINAWSTQKNKPLSFMIAGTSGVGKTFTAKNIYSSLAEDGYKFVKTFMPEFQCEGDSWKLLGTTFLSGCGKDAPLFAARKRSDKLVILFDEIEKAHPSLIAKIMCLMDKGFLADGSGVNYDFRQSIIVFTTNLAMTRLLEKKRELTAANVQVASEEFQEATRKILKDCTMPHEICDRVDWLLVYNTLGSSAIAQIALEEIRKLGKEYDLSINNVPESYLQDLAERCSNSSEGVRLVIGEIDHTFNPLFQYAYESDFCSADKWYDIDEDMQLVESESAEIKDLEIID